MPNLATVQFIKAVSAGSYFETKRSLEEGANIHFDREFALEYAIQLKDYRLIELLLSHGAEANDRIKTFILNQNSNKLSRLFDKYQNKAWWN
jgi:hypothetical protein